MCLLFCFFFIFFFFFFKTISFIFFFFFFSSRRRHTRSLRDWSSDVCSSDLALAKVLEMSPAHVRVIACPNGGGFGGKSDPFGHEIVAGKLSMKTGRPVKITLTREEVFYCHRGRHPVTMWVRTGLKKDGTITALHFRSALDGGAYGSYGVEIGRAHVGTPVT